MSITTVELLVGSDPEVLSRLVRVVSTRPFALTMLHYWRVPGTDTRRVLLDVVGVGRSELLSKRLNRLISVHRVRLLDHYEVQSSRRTNGHPGPK